MVHSAITGPKQQGLATWTDTSEVIGKNKPFCSFVSNTGSYFVALAGPELEPGLPQLRDPLASAFPPFLFLN